MESSIRGYLATLGGFAIAVLLAVVTFGALDIASFRPGGEFANRWEVARFVLFAWGGVVLVSTEIGFAGAFASVLCHPGALRWPVQLGFVGGVGVVLVNGFGFIGRLQRQSVAPFLLLEVGTGFLVGACIAGLALAIKLVLPKHAGA